MAQQINPIEIIRLLRPKQWFKNFFIFAALIFSGLSFSTAALIPVLSAFALFCLAASLVYVANDIADLEEDRAHPTKSKQRPLANGSVSLSTAKALCAGMALILALGLWFLPHLTPVVVIYLFLNVLYTLWLKKQPVIDILLIVSFFMLRVYAGAVAAEVPLSMWMLVTTMSISLFLASVKRRQEMLSSGSQSRQVLERYSLDLINQFINLSATCSLVFYTLFVITIRQNLALTTPIVLFGLLRYLYIVHIQGEGESPTHLLLKDWQLLMAIGLWLATCIYFI